MDSAYIQSPTLKLALGLGGLLDSIYVPDSCCMGENNSGSGENLEGGGKEMTGEFISRENGDCGEKKGSDLNEGILETINGVQRGNLYAPGAAPREWAVVSRTAGGRSRERGKS